MYKRNDSSDKSENTGKGSAPNPFGTVITNYSHEQNSSNKEYRNDAKDSQINTNNRDE